MTPETHVQAIAELLARVRVRWRTLAALNAAVRGALGCAAVIVLALIVSLWSVRSPLALAVTGAIAAACLVAVVAWTAWPLRRSPSDGRVGRFIEERDPDLEDRLASAIDLIASGRHGQSPAIAAPMLADAAARAGRVDPNAIVPDTVLRRAWLQGAVAALILALIVVAARGPAREAYDAAWLTLFPTHVKLIVAPGDARITAGQSLAIQAHLAGNRAPVTPQVQIGDGQNWHAAAMTSDGAGRFRLALESIASSFKYRVVAGALTSATYTVSVAHPPRVTRIDVEYTFPSELGLKPRTEEDSGDIYAPAGTDVRVRVHTDRPAAAGRLTLGGGQALPLAADAPDLWTASLKVVEDTSYRVTLGDSEGRTSPGDMEYFIRTLADRPPEVHIVKPASDRAVTRLEEVDVEAQADDDYGIARLDLVYALRGAAEHVVPFRIPPRATSVTGRQTLYLEDLDVQPGDFISYYVRAHDLTRGTRANEARSDIFFLEVKPFDQEFSLAQSQSMAGSGYNGSIDDLVNAQKAVVVATFKLDRRARSTQGTQSEQDVRSVSRTEAELKARVDQTSSSFRESTMRDPRRPQRGGAPKAGETMPEEDSMALAGEAMGEAVSALDALKTAGALPHEMEALNALLKAQAQVKERQITRQASGQGGPGNNNRNYDVSTLFDKELQRTQQSSYETKNSVEPQPASGADALDRIKDLARRQDELLKRQQTLARDRDKMTAEEIKRQLEQLTREQSELRQRAEELANSQSNSQQSSSQQQSNNQPSSSQQSKSQQASGQQSGRSGKSSESGDAMRSVAEEMRNAASELRRQDPAQASASGSRAVEKLNALERQMQGSGRAASADAQRRKLGDMQLEARQLADAERQLASELDKLEKPGSGGAGAGDSKADTTRRLGGEQERLADRTKALQEGLKRQAGAGAASGEIQRQRLPERMQQSADAMRGGKSVDPSTGTSKSVQEMARTLDKAADAMAVGTGAADEARKLSEQLARAQQLRDRLDSSSRAMEKLGQQSGSGNGRSAQKTPGETGRSGQGQNGNGEGGDLAQLREEYARQLKETQDLLREMQRDDPAFSRGGAGFTYEGQGMTLSAPGTEAFKQDFAKWQDLRRQATTALDHVESALSKKLQAQQSKDRLAAGVEDKAPSAYQKQVDSYFKALAAKRKP